MLPCSMERDVDPITTDLQDRCDVRLERIPDHQEFRSPDIQKCKQFGICPFILVGNDFHMVEEFSEPGTF